MTIDPFDLPAELLDEAAGRLAGVEGAARDLILTELAAGHPEHALTLRALGAALLATDRAMREAQAPQVPDDPATIGSYRVERRLGEGGFGVVYACSQERPVRRLVAVKVLRPGAGDRNTLARFATEQQVLVGLDHPSIAVMIDAGAMPDGRPWFAMEHVDGVPITAACDRDCLGVDERLRLFVELCAAVQHAHMRGVIHRDLKPGNVLVTRRDGRLHPKVIDFGIAKALHQDALSGGATRTGRVIGTPGYMSPEQAAGRGHAIDTRSDVFSLGVMLYELLVGELPWRDPDTAASGAPPRPSLRVSSDGARSTSVADRRATAPRQLASKLRGDLDWIVLKALDPTPELRYHSARSLAEDVERHLRGEAVSAGPPSKLYLLRKFARRHRTAVAAGALVLAAVVVGAVVSFAYYRQAQARAADAMAALRGEQAARAAAQVGFDSALGALDALLARVAELRLADAPRTEAVQRALLTDALGFYRKLLADHGADARLRGELLEVRERVAALQLELGDQAGAEREVRAALAELEGMRGDAGARWAPRGLVRTARFHSLAGRANLGRDDAAAQAEFTAAVAALEAYAAAEPELARVPLAYGLLELGSFLASRDQLGAGAQLVARAAAGLQAQLAITADDARLRLKALECACFLDFAAAQGASSAEAEVGFRKLRASVAALQQHGGASDDQVAKRLVACCASLALGRQRRESHADAVASFDVAIALQRRRSERYSALPAERVFLARMERGRAHSLAKLGAADAAQAGMRAAIALQQGLVAQFPEQLVMRWDLANSQAVLVNVLLEQGRVCALLDAEALARGAVAALRAIPAEAFPQQRANALAFALGGVAHVLDALGHDARAAWEDALLAYEDLVQRAPEVPAAHDNWCRAAGRLAAQRLQAGDVDSAAELVRRARAQRAAHPAASATRVSRRNFARLLAVAAEVAAARDDAVAAAAAADEMEPWLDDWRVRQLAADALALAWQTALRAGAPLAPLATECRERADALYAATLHELQSLPAPLPCDDVNVWGQVCVRRAEIAAARGEHARAVALSAEGVAQLESARVDLHANRWRPEAYAAGFATLVRSRLARADHDGAIAALRRAAARGLVEAAWLDDAELAPLREHPEFAALARQVTAR